MQTSFRKYVALRTHPNNIDDFNWLVKYITSFGCCPNGDVNNSHSKKSIMLGGREYSCYSVNPDYTVTEIYRMPISDEEMKLVEELRFSRISVPAKSLTEAADVNINSNTQESSMDKAIEIFKKFQSSTLNSAEMIEAIHKVEEMNEKSQCPRIKNMVEKRMKEDPVVQYNLELIEDNMREMKDKIEEYNRLKSQKDDETLISLSTTGMIDIQELNDQLADLREDIEDLKYEIEELKGENEEIRNEIEEEIEDEEWEREMDRW